MRAINSIAYQGVQWQLFCLAIFSDLEGDNSRFFSVVLCL